MAISFACPGCAAPFRLADTMAGKRAKCPKCELLFIVPAEPGDEAVAVAPAEEAPRVKARATAGHEVQTEEAFTATRGRGGRKADPDEDDRDDRRSRRRREDPDDDEDDRPVRRRSAARKRGGPQPWIWFVCGGAVLLVLVCGGVVTSVVVLAIADAPVVVGPAVGAPPPFAVAGLNVGANQGGIKAQLAGGVFVTNDQLTPQDPHDPEDPECHCKRYLIELEGGKSYTIDLRAPRFDAYLRLEEQTGAVLGEDDDGGGALNSRLQFRPTRTDTYVIVATSLDPALGPFTLTVRESKGLFR